MDDLSRFGNVSNVHIHTHDSMIPTIVSRYHCRFGRMMIICGEVGRTDEFLWLRALGWYDTRGEGVRILDRKSRAWVDSLVGYADEYGFSAMQLAKGTEYLNVDFCPLSKTSRWNFPQMYTTPLDRQELIMHERYV